MQMTLIEVEITTSAKLLSCPELAGVLTEVLVKRQAEEQTLLSNDNTSATVARSGILAKLQHFIGLNRGV